MAKAQEGMARSPYPVLLSPLEAGPSVAWKLSLWTLGAGEGGGVPSRSIVWLLGVPILPAY